MLIRDRRHTGLPGQAVGAPRRQVLPRGR